MDKPLDRTALAASASHIRQRRSAPRFHSGEDFGRSLVRHVAPVGIVVILDTVLDAP